MANILDVARLAGVSPATAKRALRDPDLLHPDTLRRVLDAVATLEYEPDARAGSLRGGKSHTIGLVLGRFVEPFFAELAHSIGRTLRDTRYTLLLSENDYSSSIERKSLQQLYSQRIGALVIRPGYGDDSRDYLLRMRDRGVYVLEVDYHLEGSPFDTVMLDNEGSVRHGVEYLHGLGHTRIAALSRYDASLHPETRSRIFPQVMRDLGLGLPDAYQRVVAFREDDTHAFTHDLMNLPEPPTALFALTGTQAAGAFRALRERGLRIGKDVSLLTFDNYSWTTLVDPPLDVIEQPVRAMGEEAARLAVRALEEGPPAGGVHLTFPGRLVTRGSCGPPVTRSR